MKHSFPDEYSRLFSADYATSRQRFLDAANTLGASAHELRMASLAPDHHPLSIDIAWLGQPKPARAVIHSSGLHGVEGFSGSAIQLAIMREDLSPPSDGAIVFVHALNPYGMAWLRRFNENNVDLNRNFFALDSHRPDSSAAYRRLESFLNPRSAPAADFFRVRAAYFALRYGFGNLKQAIAEGQYEYPKGLFFGGQRMEEGPSRYQTWVGNHLGSLERGAAIDVHTGLGRSGQESLFLRRSPVPPEQLSEVLGRGLTVDASESGVGYSVRGGYANCFDVLPQATKLPVATQEFGTYPSLTVLHALREENRWHHYGDGAMTHPSKRRLKEVFTPANERWRTEVVRKGVSFWQSVAAYVFD